MARNQALKWTGLTTETVLLGMESVEVVGLRLAHFAAGEPSAALEAWRMWSEKLFALGELQARFLTGSLGATPSGAAEETLNHFRRKVSANKRRLRSTRTAQRVAKRGKSSLAN